LSDPPTAPTNPDLTSSISALRLHPALESALHLLNLDLPSAHFLVRHMSAPPAVEGMLLHSVLHRIEGHYENARAWLGDVGDAGEGWVCKKRGSEWLPEEVVREMGGGGGGEPEAGLLEFVYGAGGEREAGELIDVFERMRKEGKGDVRYIEERTRKELGRILEWCRNKFGGGEWIDARQAWVRPGEEVRKIGNEM
ncbi:hypothetical protein BCR34DRAFT_454667, partial [Clohesyomyces aquaticus]